MIKFFILTFSLVLLGCNKKAEKFEYSVYIQSDLNNYYCFLLRNKIDTIDSVSIPIDKSTYGSYKIDRKIPGWSCMNKDLLNNISSNKKNSNLMIRFENRFLNRILHDIPITKDDKVLMAKYWKQINNELMITSMDSNWTNVIDNFAQVMLNNKYIYSSNEFRIDSCEEEYYKEILGKVIEIKQTQIIMTENIRVSPTTLVNSNAYLHRSFKALIFYYNNKYIDSVQIKYLDKINFRPVDFELSL